MVHLATLRPKFYFTLTKKKGRLGWQCRLANLSLSLLLVLGLLSQQKRKKGEQRSTHRFLPCFLKKKWVDKESQFSCTIQLSGTTFLSLPLPPLKKSFVFFVGGRGPWVVSDSGCTQRCAGSGRRPSE